MSFVNSIFLKMPKVYIEFYNERISSGVSHCMVGVQMCLKLRNWCCDGGVVDAFRITA